MDMCKPFPKTVLAHVPDAAGRIVSDHLHDVKHVLETMDQVRRKEQGVLTHQGERRLTGTKFLWLITRTRTWSAKQRRAFQVIPSPPAHGHCRR
ncbi:MAG: family transposase [Gemmatimonadetes bacterium]|nr:family transposase [Gemmatimonadota bacterium]